MRKIMAVVALGIASALLPIQAQALTSPTPKVVVIVLENTQRSAIVGKDVAPFMNSLIAQGKEFTDYHGFKGSAHDYHAMIAGQQVVTKPLTNNLYHQFDAEGVSWVNLEESMGGNCGVNPSPNTVPGSNDKLYARGHDPAHAYSGNTTCDANDVPLTSDAQLQSLPSFSYIVPNNCDNAHTYPSGGDCPAYFGTNHGTSQISLADQWVAHVVGVITAADPSVTVFVTFDESTDSTGQLLYAAEIGPSVTAGSKDGTRYDHYGFCAGIWQEYGLAGTAPNSAATATPLPL
jgi:phosphatidylinositol-3-phosphatase